MKKINELYDRYNSSFILYTVTYLLLAVFSIASVVIKIHYRGLLMTGIIASILFIVELVFYFIIKKYFNTNKIHKIYLILVIFFGIFYIALFPPGGVPDESPDYKRTLEVSEFHLVSEMKDTYVGREFPNNITTVFEPGTYKDMLKNKDLKLEGEKSFINFATKALYAFLCYIPQAIGVFIGRILNLPIIIQVMLGKICNFAMFVTLTYLSIKYIPNKKNLMMFLCLIPMTMQEAASLSPDCMIIALSITLVSFVSWARVTKKVFEKKHFIALSLLLIFLSVCKIVYLPFCFLILLIPKECYKNIKNKMIYTISILLISMIISFIWLKICSPFLYSFTVYRGSNPDEQLKYIISNPFKYLKTILVTIKTDGVLYLEEMFGLYLGRIAIVTSKFLAYFSMLIVFILLSINNARKSMLKVIEQIFVGLIIVGTFILIFTSLYLQWTPVCSKYIIGIQGRYFIPLIPLISLLLLSNRKEEKTNHLVITTMLVFNLVSFVFIFNYFFV